jgi:predicted dinucleotide-binding enzyme
VTPAILVAGEDQSPKDVVFQLVRDAGFQPLNVGPLLSTRSIEQLGVLLHQVGTHHYAGDYAHLAPTLIQTPIQQGSTQPIKFLLINE